MITEVVGSHYKTKKSNRGKTVQIERDYNHMWLELETMTCGYSTILSPLLKPSWENLNPVTDTMSADTSMFLNESR